MQQSWSVLFEASSNYWLLLLHEIEFSGFCPSSSFWANPPPPPTPMSFLDSPVHQSEKQGTIAWVWNPDTRSYSQAKTKTNWDSLAHAWQFTCTLYDFALGYDGCTGFCLVIIQSDYLSRLSVECSSIWQTCLSWNCTCKCNSVKNNASVFFVL